MTIEAMKQALEALETYHGYMEPLTTVFGGPRVPAEQSTTGKVEKAITTLRQAIEQAEKQEPKCQYPRCSCNSKDWCDLKRQQALDKKAENARELGLDYEPQQVDKQKPDAWMYEFGTDHCDAVTPVRWYKNVTALKKPDPNENLVRNVRPLYLEPQREWVGLTDEEIALVCGECAASAYRHDDISYARAIEAKLKEKNT